MRPICHFFIDKKNTGARNIFLKVWLVLAFWISFSGAGGAQEQDTAGNIVAGGFIEQMSSKIGIKFSLNNYIESFLVKAGPVEYNIFPNTSLSTRLYFNYRFIFFSVSFAPNFLPGNDDDAIRGKTKTRGYGFGYSFRQWFNEFSYSKTKGYYLKNTSDFDPTWMQGDTFLQIPDLETTNFEGLTGYNFNRQFSQSAISTQTERQLKNAGSFIPVLFYRYYIVDNKAPGNTQKSNNMEVILGAGYHYTVVSKKRNGYFSAGLVPGFGYIFTKLLTRDPGGDIITHSNNPVFRLGWRLGAGYNGRLFFGGIYLNSSYSSFQQRQTTAINKNNRASYQLFVGYRLNAPKALRSGYDRTVGRFIKD